MPTDGTFGFSVLIAGLPMPEYTKDGKVYVESNLWTPVSYKQLVRELVYGEVEEQEWPVTPYQIKVYTEPHCPQSMFKVFVDGVEATDYSHVLSSGQSGLTKGFCDADGTKEFLFALPRFARDEDDRVKRDRKTKIGTIEVVRRTATYMRDEMYTVPHKEFNQANKKDATNVTQGKYTMSTTRQGKLLETGTQQYWTSIWQPGEELGRLSVEYRMAHTLQDWGIHVQVIDWTQSQNLVVKSE